MLKFLFLFAICFGCAFSVSAQDNVTIFVEKATIHSSPDAKSKVIATVEKNAVYKRIKQQGEWSKIDLGKHTGWIDNKSIVVIPEIAPLKNPEYSNGVGSGAGVGSGNGSGDKLGSGQGRGYGSGIGTGTGSQPPVDNSPPTPMRIISKPRPTYTEVARKNNIQGTVTLRITFLASGLIGNISVVEGLPSGLSEQAIVAARKIVFEPAKRNGVPITTTKLMKFSFMLY